MVEVLTIVVKENGSGSLKLGLKFGNVTGEPMLARKLFRYDDRDWSSSLLFSKDNSPSSEKILLHLIVRMILMFHLFNYG